ncbi:beta-ketoacyl synthase N-terminal-like domain-containing protein [Achromobacter xylosoxidans]|uniref:beta-ketoacyl synthase N-terminal-like domain-containing protein n=1 Tax=Alcaligenes xylosoxydans xylosoxydans TaxID=85698 RepID=UPI002239249E|nr:beta-ketoacyl synthase N-terminal-like domain-containing protein [Achromobacter xylosoxidans]
MSPVGNDLTTAWTISSTDVLASAASPVSIPRPSPPTSPAKSRTSTSAPIGQGSRQMDTFIHYGLAAGIQAWRDSGLEVTEANAERIGVIVGSGIGGLPRIEETQSNTWPRVRAASRRSSCRVR